MNFRTFFKQIMSKIVTLFCMVVGEKGSAFSIEIDENDSVSELKDAIKADNEKTITCDACELQLFLAKTSDNVWLQSSSHDVKSLKKGIKTELIQSLIHEDNGLELQAEFGIGKV